jgi:hypothetical protein
MAGFNRDKEPNQNSHLHIHAIRVIRHKKKINLL